VLLLAGFLSLLLFLEHELVVVHDPANRRLGIGDDFNQIQLDGLSGSQCFTNGNDTYLLAILVNQSNFTVLDVRVNECALIATLLLFRLNVRSPQSDPYGRCLRLIARQMRLRS